VLSGEPKVESIPVDQILEGDCLERMRALPLSSIDMIFADPPYNLQLKGDLWRPNMTKVDAVDDAWDHFASFAEYDSFSRQWLSECRRILKDTGTLWVIGTYHNIFRLGTVLQDLGYWILNDVIWIKTNPMPNFRGVRLTNAHETLIWASKSKGSRYTFNHHAMKSLNEDLQMRSDWTLPICSGRERLKVEGKKAHATQKPEALLYRVILASTEPGDIVLDPFFGTGTTGVIAKKLHRHWIGIEREPKYVALARERIEAIMPELFDRDAFEVRGKRQQASRVPFPRLLEAGLLAPGQRLYFQNNRQAPAVIKSNGHLRLPGFEGSIHQAGRHLMNGSPCNGWAHWYFEDADGGLKPVDVLRDRYLQLATG